MLLWAQVKKILDLFFLPPDEALNVMVTDGNLSFLYLNVIVQ